MYEVAVCGAAMVVLFLPSLLTWLKKRTFKRKMVLYNTVLVLGAVIIEGVLLLYGDGVFCGFLTVFMGMWFLCGWIYLAFRALNV